MLRMKNFTQQETQQIIDEYLQGKSRLKLAKEFEVSDTVILRILRQNQIPIRTISQSNSVRKYNVNDKYFDIENSNMAYILGFWAADGNVHSTENRLDLELAQDDLEILEKIQKEISNERPIKIYQCANGYIKNKLYFWSSHIKEKFIEYGIVPNKTYSPDFHAPYKLDRKFWIDYIRGFFDGDGCIKQTGGNGQYHYPQFELNSLNLTFLQDIQKHFKEYYKIETYISTAGVRKGKEKLYRLYTSGEKAKEIFSILYTPNSLYLQRKYKRWLELI